MSNKPHGYELALGLMSGTSADGIDVASLYVSSDGRNIVQTEHQPYTFDYSVAMQSAIAEVIYGGGNTKLLEKELTLEHASAAEKFLQRNHIVPAQVSMVGFHGHTILHDPANNITTQLGDGELLAKLLGIDVVYDFRTQDVLKGGQGAPLLPMYHRAIMKEYDKPLMVVNIGGVANVSWIGQNNELMACDTGPGNALINDAMVTRTARHLDVNGKLASTGIADQAWIDAIFADDYFHRHAPKSLDRNYFHHYLEDSRFLALSDADAIATLTALTAQSIIASQQLFPSKPAKWVITGGGRHNQTMMMMLKHIAGDTPVVAIEALGFNGDAVEAEGFAMLAVLSKQKQPFSFPDTTGVDSPCTGGIYIDYNAMFA